MIIKLHLHFKKSYKKRIKGHPNLEKKFKQRVSLFTNNPNHPTLKNHKLTGSLREYMSFSITGDIRVIYFELSADTFIFYDIGSHNQVY